MASLTRSFPTSPPKRLVVPRELWESMRLEVARIAPEEACGLLGGHGERVKTMIPVQNELRSPLRFRMEPRGQLTALRELEQAGLDLVGIYHSHPRGPSRPSPTDVEEAYYPEAVSLIWSGEGEAWSCRGFHIVQGEVREIPLIWEGKESNA